MGMPCLSVRIFLSKLNFVSGVPKTAPLNQNYDVKQIFFGENNIFLNQNWGSYYTGKILKLTCLAPVSSLMPGGKISYPPYG